MRDTLFRPRGTFFSCAALCLTACDGVSLEVLSPPTDASALDASDATPDADATVEASSCVLLSVGASCAYSEECCSGLCALDTTSRQTCRPTTGCVGLGGACKSAGACCSLDCFAPDGTSGLCTDTSLCAPVASPCNQPQDCCSNLCNNGTCAKPPGPPPCLVAGETCNGNPDCCGGVCATASDQTLRCTLLQGCRVTGEICTAANDCCSGVCTGGRCAPPMACNTGDGKGCKSVAWDTCANDGECCSRKCLAQHDGAFRCVPIGGCAPLCERCNVDTDCCSGSCVGGRCKATAPCGSAGEVCTTNPQCCGGPAVTCVTDPTSLAHRCESSSACASTSGSCAVGRDCCSGECLPMPPMQCANACVADGDRCTTSTDCCSKTSDCFELDGALVCAPLIH